MLTARPAFSQPFLLHMFLAHYLHTSRSSACVFSVLMPIFACHTLQVPGRETRMPTRKEAEGLTTPPTKQHHPITLHGTEGPLSSLNGHIEGPNSLIPILRARGMFGGPVGFCLIQVWDWPVRRGRHGPCAAPHPPAAQHPIMKL